MEARALRDLAQLVANVVQEAQKVFATRWACKAVWNADKYAKRVAEYTQRLKDINVRLAEMRRRAEHQAPADAQLAGSCEPHGSSAGRMRRVPCAPGLSVLLFTLLLKMIISEN